MDIKRLVKEVFDRVPNENPPRRDLMREIEEAIILRLQWDESKLIHKPRIGQQATGLDYMRTKTSWWPVDASEPVASAISCVLPLEDYQLAAVDQALANLHDICVTLREWAVIGSEWLEHIASMHPSQPLTREAYIAWTKQIARDLIGYYERFVCMMVPTSASTLFHHAVHVLAVHECGSLENYASRVRAAHPAHTTVTQRALNASTKYIWDCGLYYYQMHEIARSKASDFGYAFRAARKQSILAHFPAGWVQNELSSHTPTCKSCLQCLYYDLMHSTSGLSSAEWELYCHTVCERESTLQAKKYEQRAHFKGSLEKRKFAEQSRDDHVRAQSAQQVMIAEFKRDMLEQQAKIAKLAKLAMPTSQTN